MKHTILLHGIDYAVDKAQIEAAIGLDPIFLLDEPKTELHQYIDYLHEECGLRTKIINRLRICRQILFKGDVTLLSHEGMELGHPHSMEELVKQLQPGTHFRLVIENNDRSLLADIVQQLIYINYPITEIDIKLRKEYKDAAKTALFMENIQTLQAAAQSAVDRIAELCLDTAGAEEETRTKLYETRALALASYQKICEQIEKAMDIEMKVAVAASKKTGKSVIVNCMLGMELAPTSLELATPNNCIYQRSHDNRFHLQTIEDPSNASPVEDFEDAEALHQRISREFKKAQVNSESGLCCPDMHISYVSNGNHFESYTVYDTPGPDLAGADHRERTEKAINECDVAVFAIDYTKYLTTSEEEFLREIKAIFEEKHKFHTLIFVINKMDQALNDKGTKSRIKSIDFIRHKLQNIDTNYKDCIVFATSAQDYFWSLELEQAAEQLEDLSCLRDSTADLYQNLRPCKDALEAEDCEDENLIDLLSNLDGEVGRIRSQLGYPVVDMNTLRLYSGIPQLMDYVSYIARSKAREEIVNSITYTIATQCSTLQTILCQIANVDELMGKTQQEIDHISAILNDYVATIEVILGDNLREEDLCCLKPNHTLRAQIAAYQGRTDNQGFPVALSDVLKTVKEDIAHPSEDYKVGKVIWDIFFSSYCKKIEKYKGQVVPKTLLNVTHNDVINAIQTYQSVEIHKRITDENWFIEGLAQDLQSVLQGRSEQLKQCSEQCQQQLKKNDCYLQLPELPTFEAAIAIPQFSDSFTSKPKFITFKPLPEIYTNPNIIEKISSLLKHVSKGEWIYEKEIKVKHIPKEEQVSDLRLALLDWLGENRVYADICQSLDLLAQGFQQAVNSVLAQFSEMNQSYVETVAVFRQGIDDRSYYQDKLADYERMKELIFSIQGASKEFLDTWALVVNE